MSFINQLEASVGPVDFLGGLLLDRIAANCLRQQELLDIQRLTAPDLTVMGISQRTPERVKQDITAHWFASLLKYESFLNQVFHRDLILLQALQKAHPVAPLVSPKKPPQSDRSLIEGPADGAVARQGIDWIRAKARYEPG